ncbi:LysM peptidoglycan-binding domain-containing protein [Candidatus Thiothrix sp. Deng01]|uniref:LysM peptidoglycan-binding domain-containing protein n=1 Tax=Candidatus Thiothrix phosphatis TaxID=3112415 RepID=A0ABU6CXT8_9GAMM|nr:LysM peptidoglycan-binding domain-containing protein [Candidatus Thiothrix sp. Deng01]MEB4590887.1 LysM peptidoglycan-binding domain-containing protein [Candidatus Thiothrix sp. Deng01]
MDRKIRLAAASSLLAMTVAACTPNPYYNGYNYGSGSNTQASGGVVNRAAVTHSHCGRVHSHVLPPQGLAHDHGDGCIGAAAGGGAVATVAPPQNYNNYTQPAYTVPQQPATTYSYNSTPATTTYDYSAGNTSGYASNYDYSAYSSPKTGTSGYSSYTAPKTTTSSSSTYRSTAPGSVTSSSNYYTVQKGDTVFQVMRNTGVYWKDIIRLNNLQAPDYKLAPGQTLKLK